MINSYAFIHPPAVHEKPGWFRLQIEDDVSHYYNWFHQTGNNPPWRLAMNGVHITFIAGEHERRIIDVSELTSWLNEPIPYSYEPTVLTEGRSFWIPCESDKLEKIRFELGLPSRKDRYHITLGNYK